MKTLKIEVQNLHPKTVQIQFCTNHGKSRENNCSKGTVEGFRVEDAYITTLQTFLVFGCTAVF